MRLGRVRSPFDSRSRQIVLNTFEDVAGRSRALLRTPAIVRNPSLARAKLIPLRGARTLSLDVVKRRSLDWWGLTYWPFPSKRMRVLRVRLLRGGVGWGSVTCLCLFGR